MRVVVAGLGVQGHKRRTLRRRRFRLLRRSGQRATPIISTSRMCRSRPTTPCSPASRTSRSSSCSAIASTTASTCWSRSRSGSSDDEDILDAREPARAPKAWSCYTAYNHRFEPHFVRMRDLIASGELGAIYSCRMFYGNGTARLVREFGVARPGRRRAARSRLASARYLPFLVRRFRRRVQARQRPPFREPRARPCRDRQRRRRARASSSR